MTNLEIFEIRFPVRVEALHYCIGSGGDGKYKRGYGVVCPVSFLKEIAVNIILTRRESR
jgi:N-methylhydantoinase B/oxoprolinase/acetone carboxylase alpha subunit